jgi:protein-S-isoprenylcysteine O-methyltransferase Ste14
VALLAESGWILLLVVPATLFIRYAVIGREERYLAAKFGDEYARYRRTVRRWI